MTIELKRFFRMEWLDQHHRSLIQLAAMKNVGPGLVGQVFFWWDLMNGAERIQCFRHCIASQRESWRKGHIWSCYMACTRGDFFVLRWMLFVFVGVRLGMAKGAFSRNTCIRLYQLRFAIAIPLASQKGPQYTIKNLVIFTHGFINWRPLHKRLSFTSIQCCHLSLCCVSLES